MKIHIGTFVALVLFLGTPLSFAGSELERARQMLQQLERDRSEAGKTHRQFTADEIEQRLIRIQRVVNQGILSLLNQTSPPARGQLEKSLWRMQGIPEGSTGPGLASVLSNETSGRRVFVVAYTLVGAIAMSRSWIGVFGSDESGGPFEVLASADNTLPNKTVAVELLGTPRRKGLVLLAYGVNWGDAHNRLTVIAYSFSGRRLEPIWSRADLPQGEVKTEDDKIKLTFLSSPLGPGHKSVHSVTQIYRHTPAGIRLESMHPVD
ncbi:MAG: hypothetical protein ABSG54_02820 [Terriglobia bacterium]